jgi:hypothetical protein
MVAFRVPREAWKLKRPFERNSIHSPRGEGRRRTPLTVRLLDICYVLGYSLSVSPNLPFFFFPLSVVPMLRSESIRARFFPTKVLQHLKPRRMQCCPFRWPTPVSEHFYKGMFAEEERGPLSLARDQPARLEAAVQKCQLLSSTVQCGSLVKSWKLRTPFRFLRNGFQH